MSETKDWMERMCQTYSHGRMWPSMSDLNPQSYTPDPVRMGYPGNELHAKPDPASGTLGTSRSATSVPV